jgi:hypothetical protein
MEHADSCSAAFQVFSRLEKAKTIEIEKISYVFSNWYSFFDQNHQKNLTNIRTCFSN